jgi:hypothetical protein
MSRCAIGCLQPVFRIPDLARDGRDPLGDRPDHRIGIHIHSITISLAWWHWSSDSLSLVRVRDRGKDVAATAGAAVRLAPTPVAHTLDAREASIVS